MAHGLMAVHHNPLLLMLIVQIFQVFLTQQEYTICLHLHKVVINPEECIDCGVCEPECPADAIQPDTAHGAAAWVETNQKYADIWPVIFEQKDPLPDAEKWDGVEGKWEHFSENPGEGS